MNYFHNGTPFATTNIMLPCRWWKLFLPYCDWKNNIQLGPSVGHFRPFPYQNSNTGTRFPKQNQNWSSRRAIFMYICILPTKFTHFPLYDITRRRMLPKQINNQMHCLVLRFGAYLVSCRELSYLYTYMYGIPRYVITISRREITLRPSNVTCQLRRVFIF